MSEKVPDFTDEENPVKDQREVMSRKDRMTGSTHFGDKDFYEEAPEEIGDATWGEVCRACCVHTPKEWAFGFVALIVLCFFLYFFLLGLELLGTSAKIIGGCTAGSLLGNDTNPVAALMIGILATVLLQSSSTTTSIVVSLVGGGLDVKTAIYMIMGANIGTSVTNTIVAMGQMGDGDQLERAFAGATVHDMFNFLTVAILLPVEVITHYLYHITKAMLPDDVDKGDKWEGPIKKIVSPLGKLIIIANKNVIKDIATGKKENCDEYYPVKCEGGVVGYETCKTGLVGCDKGSKNCPAFFEDGATKTDDTVSGLAALILALVILIICLIGLVTLLQKMLLGVSTRIIYKATNINGYVAMMIGCGITILVQSSSITTSTLTPLVGMGVLQLEQMLPLTLGANIGTTFTAIMAALVSDKVESLQVALAHLFFNLTGIAIWYPIPFMRRVPLNLARQLGKATRIWRGFPIVYIIVMFFILPLVLLGLSAMFEQGNAGVTVVAALLTAAIFLGICYFVFWWKFREGKEKSIEWMSNRQKMNTAKETLPRDMEEIKEDVQKLREHTGLQDGPRMGGKLNKRAAYCNMPDDVAYLKTEITRLKEHAGMPDEEREERVEDAKTISEVTDTKTRAVVMILLVACFGLVLWGVIALFMQGAVGYNCLGALVLIGAIFVTALIFYKWNVKDGKAKFIAKRQNKQKLNSVLKELQSDMNYLRPEVEKLKDHTGLPEEGAEGDDGAKQLEASDDSDEGGVVETA